MIINPPIKKNELEFQTLEEFLNKEFPLTMNIHDYFTYHPPDDQRRLKHLAINGISQATYQRLIGNCDIIDDSDRRSNLEKIVGELINFAVDICDDFVSIQWAIRSINDNDMDNNPAKILMKMQQFRMFLNQGVTVDSLKASQLTNNQ